MHRVEPSTHAEAAGAGRARWCKVKLVSPVRSTRATLVSPRQVVLTDADEDVAAAGALPVVSMVEIAAAAHERWWWSRRRRWRWRGADGRLTGDGERLAGGDGDELMAVALVGGRSAWHGGLLFRLRSFRRCRRRAGAARAALAEVNARWELELAPMVRALARYEVGRAAGGVERSAGNGRLPPVMLRLTASAPCW